MRIFCTSLLAGAPDVNGAFCILREPGHLRQLRYDPYQLSFPLLPDHARRLRIIGLERQHHYTTSPSLALFEAR